jgi:ADP-ribose pyrophosphatase
VFAGQLLVLEVDEVELPGGGSAVREVIRHPGAAIVLPLTADDRIVMVRQFRYAIAADLLELPAGKLDPGEDAATAARRELAEEVGLASRELVALGSFFTAPGFSDEIIHAFVARQLEATAARPDPDEVLIPQRLTMSELGALLRAGRIRDAKTLATIALAAAQGWLPAGLEAPAAGL